MPRPTVALLLDLALIAALPGISWADAAGRLVYVGVDGALQYEPYDSRGDRIPDFSHSGYASGGVALPDVAAALELDPPPDLSDSTGHIQDALDRIAAMAPDEHGYRGALLLRRGVYNVAGTLSIAADGVVLRGEGSGKDGTILFASGAEKRSLIQVGATDPPDAPAAPVVRVTDPYVPVGATSFRVDMPDAFEPGDTVHVWRMVNDAWIKHIGMDRLKDLASEARKESTKNWTPRSYCIRCRRTVTAMNGDMLTIDAPIVCALDERWGGGEVQLRTDSAITNVGVESLRVVSEFAPTTKAAGTLTYYSDEAHCNRAVRLDRVRDGWVLDIVAVHAEGCVSLAGGATRVTVQDCAAVDPVSVITGGRRYPFVSSAQQCLIQRCYAESSRHAFAYGSRVPGPNVVLDCLAVTNYGASEPHHRWATGGLFDNFCGRLLMGNRGAMGSGHGWAGAGFVAWNTEGSAACQSPPDSPNFAIGHVGERSDGPYAKVSPQGTWESHGEHVEPRSLYLAQLRDRLGDEAVEAVTIPEQRAGAIYAHLRAHFGTGRRWEAGLRPDWESGYAEPWAGLLADLEAWAQ